MKVDAWKDILSQSSYFKSGPGDFGGSWGDLKSWKTLRVEGLG